MGRYHNLGQKPDSTPRVSKSSVARLQMAMRRAAGRMFGDAGRALGASRVVGAVLGPTSTGGPCLYSSSQHPASGGVCWEQPLQQLQQRRGMQLFKARSPNTLCAGSRAYCVLIPRSQSQQLAQMVLLHDTLARLELPPVLRALTNVRYCIAVT